MSTAELKERLIADIEKIDDEHVLQDLLDVIEFYAELRGELTLEEIDAINEGRRQIANGQFLTAEESNKRVDEWLNKHAGL